MAAVAASEAAAAASPVRRTSRTRVSVARLGDDYKVAEKVAFVAPKGSGQSIADMEHVAAWVNKLTRSDAMMQNLHKIFYGRRGVKATIKRNVMNFSGITYGDGPKAAVKSREAVQAKLYQWTMPMIKNVMDKLGIDRSSKTGGVDKEALCNRFTDWLENPQECKKLATKATSKAEKKRQAKFKKQMKNDPNRPKRAMTSYLAFAKSVRPSISSENPQMSLTDTSKLIGERWNALTAEEKAPFEKAAAEDRERYQREMETYVPAPAPPKKKKKKKMAKKKKKTKSASSPSRSKASSSRSAATTTVVRLAPLFPNSRYMLTKNPPKKRKSTGRSRTVRKRQRKAEDEDEDEDEEDEDDEEESDEDSDDSDEGDEDEDEDEEVSLAVAAIPVPTDKMRAAITEILSSSGAAAFTMRSVRDQLEAKFNVKLKEHKQGVKELVVAAMNSRNS